MVTSKLRWVFIFTQTQHYISDPHSHTHTHGGSDCCACAHQPCAVETRQDGRMSRASRFGRSRGFGPHGFYPWLSQTNDLKVYTCRSLTRRSALSGYDKDWFTQCQDNVTEWDIRLWCWWHGPQVEQHYECVLPQVRTSLDLTLDVARM